MRLEINKSHVNLKKYLYSKIRLITNFYKKIKITLRSYNKVVCEQLQIYIKNPCFIRVNLWQKKINCIFKITLYLEKSQKNYNIAINNNNHLKFYL